MTKGISKIRWRTQDKLKLSRYVAKFNASLTRFAKKNPELADSGVLPQRLDVESVKKRIKTRNDFNAFIRSIDRWFRYKSSKYIVNVAGAIKKTKWEYQEAKYNERRVNRNRERIRKITGINDREARLSRLDAISVEDKEEQLKEKIKGIGAKYDFNDIGNITAEWDSFVKQLARESSERYISSNAHKYFNSYKKALKENLSGEQVDRILKLIDDLGIDAYSLFLITSSNDLADIDFVYGPEDAEERTKTILENIEKTQKELKAAGML